MRDRGLESHLKTNTVFTILKYVSTASETVKFHSTVEIESNLTLSL